MIQRSAKNLFVLDKTAPDRRPDTSPTSPASPRTGSDPSSNGPLPYLGHQILATVHMGQGSSVA